MAQREGSVATHYRFDIPLVQSQSKRLPLLTQGLQGQGLRDCQYHQRRRLLGLQISPLLTVYAHTLFQHHNSLIGSRLLSTIMTFIVAKLIVFAQAVSDYRFTQRIHHVYKSFVLFHHG